MDFDTDLDLKNLGPVRTEVEQLMNEAVMGPIELVQRTFKVVRENPSVSMWVQLTSVLPMTIVNLLISVKAFSSVTEPFQRLLAEGGPVGDTFRAPNPGFAFLLCLIVFGLKIVLIRAIFFTIGSLHHGKSVTIADVFQAQPRLWRGFTIIQSWGIVFEFGTLFIIGFVSAVLTFYSFRLKSVYASIGVFVGPIVLMTHKFILIALFQAANGVTSFEGTYGLAAIKKGWWLLKGRWKVALGLFSILIIPRITADYFLVLAAASSPNMQVSSVWRNVVQWLIFVIPVVMMSFLVQFTVTAWTLFYISCKAYHNEGFFIHSDNYPASDYERVGNIKLVTDFIKPV